MKPTELLNQLDTLLDQVGTAVLATVDETGTPHMRWMTPTLLKDRPGSLYALTTPSSTKAMQVEKNPQVEWMVQDRALRTIVNVKGVLHLVKNPSLEAEIVEALGRRLSTFWRVNPDDTDIVAVETQITDMRFFRSMQGTREVLSLRPGPEEEQS